MEWNIEPLTIIPAYYTCLFASIVDVSYMVLLLLFSILSLINTFFRESTFCTNFFSRFSCSWKMTCWSQAKKLLLKWEALTWRLCKFLGIKSSMPASTSMTFEQNIIEGGHIFLIIHLFVFSNNSSFYFFLIIFFFSKILLSFNFNVFNQCLNLAKYDPAKWIKIAKIQITKHQLLANK